MAGKHHTARISQWIIGGVVALAVWLGQAAPALAHEWDGDPAHLLEDLALNFGLPLLVLVIGAVAGVVLSGWLARRQGDEDAAGDEEIGADEEPLVRSER